MQARLFIMRPLVKGRSLLLPLATPFSWRWLVPATRKATCIATLEKEREKLYRHL